MAAESNVVFNFKIGSADKSAADVAKIAVSAKDAGKAAEDAAAKFAKMNAAASGGGAAGGPAAGRSAAGPSTSPAVNRAAEDARRSADFAVRNSVEEGRWRGQRDDREVRGSSGVAARGGTGPNAIESSNEFANLQQGSRGRARLAVALSAVTVGGGLSRAANTIEEQTSINDSAATSVKKVTLAFADGLPILGSMVKGVHDWTDAISGAKQGMEAAAAATKRLQTTLATNQSVRGVESQRDEQIGAMGRTRADLADRARNLGIRVRSLQDNPGDFEGFRNDETSAAAAANLAVGRGRFEVGSQESVATRRRQEEAEASARMPEADAREREARQRLARSEQSLANLGKTESAGMFGAGSKPVGPASNDETAANRAAKTNAVMDDRLKLADALNQKADAADQLAKAQARSEESLVGLAQKKLELKKAESAVLQANLDKVKEEQSRVREASAAAIASPLDTSATLAAFRKFKSSGIGSLNEGEQGLLRGNALTREAFGKAAEDSAGQNPVFQDLLKETGNRGLNELGNERVRLTQEITIKGEFDEAEFAEQSLKVLNRFFDKIVVTLNAQTEAKIAELRLNQAITNAQP